MATTLASPFRAAPTPPAILTLEPDDVGALRQPSTRGSRALREALRGHPGRSVWAPATLEYAVLGPWRHRPEISYLEELAAVRHADELLQEAYQRCVDHGDALMLAIDLETHRARSRFERAGLELLEEVITYELPLNGASRPFAATIARLAPVSDAGPETIDQLLRLDHAAFPWLWRNSRREFETYVQTPGVRVAMLEMDGHAAAYVGATLFSGWGHIDRIAVAPNYQGAGLGRQVLAQAIDALRTEGARRVCLSTQATNWRSRRLYEGVGFLRTPENDYQLFGVWCNTQTTVESRVWRVGSIR
jgi:ribosomal protein S18 acetylase RimI-like enzyme